MHNVTHCLIATALVLVCLSMCRVFMCLRGVLIAAVLGAAGGDGWLFLTYGLYGIPNIVYILIPAAAIALCLLIFLASTNFRSFLILGSVLAALAVVGYLLNLLAPVGGILLVLLLLRSAGRESSGSGSLFKAWFVHSCVPEVSVGEAYMASEADLI
jgi:hypothetical protein